MNGREFSVLSEDLDLCKLLVNSVCIAERTIDGLKVLLFQKGGTYIEVIFNEAGDEIATWWEFKSTDTLEPYLEQIALPDFD